MFTCTYTYIVTFSKATQVTFIRPDSRQCVIRRRFLFGPEDLIGWTAHMTFLCINSCINVVMAPLNAASVFSSDLRWLWLPEVGGCVWNHTQVLKCHTPSTYAHTDRTVWTSDCRSSLEPPHSCDLALPPTHCGTSCSMSGSLPLCSAPSAAAG